MLAEGKHGSVEFFKCPVHRTRCQLEMAINLLNILHDKMMSLDWIGLEMDKGMGVHLLSIALIVTDAKEQYHIN